jgi:hypothetical protein
VSDVVRVAMWSGPRNISTAMMRSFGARPDTHVVDEPFYAAYLAGTNVDHPMRADVLASQPVDWREVVQGLLADPPSTRPIFYQKHMTHHMLPGFSLDWMKACRNAFLIRDPELVLASYTAKRGDVTLADIGLRARQTGSAKLRRWSKASTCCAILPACCRNCAWRSALCGRSRC